MRPVRGGFVSDPDLHDCPFCGLLTDGGPRYPRALCGDCTARATDSAGQRIRGYNISLSGGFEARHVTADGSGGSVCDEVTQSGRCRVDGVECEIGEARFGGVVIEAPPS